MISSATPPAIEDVHHAIKFLHLDRCRPESGGILVRHFTRPSITVCMSSEIRRKYAKSVRKVVNLVLN